MTNHITIYPAGPTIIQLACEVCVSEQRAPGTGTITLPCQVDIVLAMVERFVEEHRGCGGRA